MSRNMHKYEELTPYEFDREKERASIIYVGSGPLEYHEEPNALGIDLFKGYQWCLDSAEINGGIVFPPLPVAPDWFWPLDDWESLRERWNQVKFGEYTKMPLLYPGVMFSRDTAERVYRELLETFADFLGFKLCVFIGSHSPAGQMIKYIVARENGLCGEWELPGRDFKGGKFHGMQVMAVGSLDYNSDVVKAYYAEHDIKRVNHGGLWEAAINYAINPEYYRPELLDETKYPQHYGALKEEHFEGCLRPVKSEFRKFTPKFAAELYQTTVRRLADDVRKIYQELTNS